MDILLLLVVVALFITPVMVFARNVVEPYMNGTKQVDPIKRPILSRAHRIIRANNTKAREKEARIRLGHFEGKRLEVERAIDKAIESSRKESQDKHLTAIYKWDADFSEVTRERDEQIRREKEAAEAEARRKAEAERAAIRERELAIWTANEKARLARFEAEQKALQAEEDRRVASLLEQRERDIQALTKHKMFSSEMGNQNLIVLVHSLYARKLPTKASRIVDALSQNSWVTVNGWIAHEEVYGNPIWFRLSNGEGWIWSGGLNNASTTGLENLNYLKEPGDSFTVKSVDGMINQTYTAPSVLESMIDSELALLKMEKRDTEQAALTRTSSDRTIPAISNRKNALLSPRQVAELINGTPQQVAELVDGTTQYQFPIPRSTGVDFWRGTEFERN